MDQNQQGSADTGTKDETYDVISVLYHALQGVENTELFAEDASHDPELKQFFDRACDQQRQLAEEAKRLLHDRLMREAQGGGSGSGSAFGQFGSSGGSSATGSAQGQQAGSTSTSGLSPNSSDAGHAASFGQSALGQGQRHTQMTTGGGGTSTF